MYSSLDKLDFAADGIGIQTDHRAAEEIDRTRDVSVVMALTRLYNPWRMEQEGVRYVCMQQPPEWFMDLLRISGASIELPPSEATGPVGAPDLLKMNQLGGHSLQAIGLRVHEERGFSLDRDGIRAAETYYAELNLDRSAEDDEIDYWTSVIELAAFCGEAMKFMSKGSWEIVHEADSAVPFLFRTNVNVLLNIFKRSERLFDQGLGSGPSTFFLSATPEAAEPGPTMMNIKPASWAHGDAAWSEPIVSNMQGAADIPIVAYGKDLPTQFAYFMREQGDRSLKELRVEACRHLAKIEVQITEITPSCVVVHDDYYASEKILDEAFMMELQGRFQAEMLLVSMPLKSRLIVASAMGSGDPLVAMAGMMNITQKMYEEDPHHQLSMTIFTVMNGKVAGIARATSEPVPEKPTKRWWQRIFG